MAASDPTVETRLMTGMTRFCSRQAAGRLLVIGLLLWMTGGRPGPMVAADDSESPTPLLAYYYIWFEERSWDRAKVDYPQLGQYDSDDEAVMRQHVRWAKEAGIDGFIVSWKSTLTLDARLELLMDVAREENFKLAVIYQGLDFHREPLPVDRIDADMDRFSATYADDPVFNLFGGPPVMIWSGTWKFDVDQIAQVTEGRSIRSGCEWENEVQPTCLQLLSSERNVGGIERVDGLFDGNAYYWSSVNPDTFPGYDAKLQAMGNAVHEAGGLWIAPAAPGFDARLIGGTTVVERRDGDTLRREIDAARSSSPDAIGVISWNEFSENSHIEPSEMYGTTALEVLSDMVGGRPPTLPELDSSQPGEHTPLGGLIDWIDRAAAIGLVAAAVAFGWMAIARRQRAKSIVR